ncbi:MAG: ABC transporter permease subunit [Eubacterium sp.]|nr:ABC transporter permease subunit [Eubacterium sp.]
MWTIWKEELFKIASRKIVWLGMFLLALFIGWRLYAERSNYTVTIDGQIYFGQEAICLDQKLTAGYAGIFTEQTVKKIYEDFGFYYHDMEKDVSIGNFCNYYITQHMTNYNQVDSPVLENVRFLEGKYWEQNVAPLLNGTYLFDYTYGWNDLKETYSILTVMAISVLFIIGLSPVFAEEYSLKTANILLTTKRGKKCSIWIKAAAAAFLVTVVYCLFTAYIWLLYWTVYGTQGLDASAVFIGIMPGGYAPADIRGFFLFSFALGLAGLILLTCITLAISALCKNAFLAVVISLAVFCIPYVWMHVSILFAPIISKGIREAISHFMASMPFYLPVNWGFVLTARQLLIHLGIALASGICCMAGMYYAYHNYQG